MLRIKRSVQATYNMRINVTSQMIATGKRIDGSSTLAGQKRPREEGAMASLERTAEAPEPTTSKIGRAHV